MKLEMIKSLKSRFAGAEENRLLSIATILDPRFKDKFFASNIIKTSVKEMLNEEMQKIVDKDNSLVSGEQSVSSRSSTPSPKRAKKDTLLTVYSEIIDNSGASASVSLDEVECYLGEPLLDYKSGNPFKWWGENNARFPILAQLAKRFLSGTATVHLFHLNDYIPKLGLCMKNIETGCYHKMLKLFCLSRAIILCLVKKLRSNV